MKSRAGIELTVRLTICGCLDEGPLGSRVVVTEAALRATMQQQASLVRGG